MKNFAIIFPDGTGINEKTKIKNAKGEVRVLADEKAICDFLKRHWCNWTKSKSFTDWANELNADINRDGGETKESALDHLSSNYILNIDTKHVNIYDLFMKYKPFKSTANETH